MATDTVNLRQLGYIVLPASFAIALIALVSKLNSKKNKADQTLPTVHWKWFSRSQQLLGTPYRAMLAVETYKPLYGDILQLSEPFKQIVMLNSYEVASDVLEKLSEVTSDRPRNVVVVEMTGLNRQIAFRNHDEGHKRLRRVIASGLHPAAARSYTDMHTSTTAFFLLDVFNRITQRTGNDRNAIDTKSPDTNYHSKAVTASIKDSIGRFIMRMAFGYIVGENDPLLQRQNALLDEVISNLATHYWANDFPILCHLPSWFPGAEFKRRMDRIYSMRQRALRETFETVLQKAVRGDILPPLWVMGALTTSAYYQRLRRGIQACFAASSQPFLTLAASRFCDTIAPLISSVTLPSSVIGAVAM